MNTRCIAFCGIGLLASCTAEDDVSRQWPIDEVSGLRVPTLGPVPELPEWPDNPPTEAKRELGFIVFNDPRLSGSGQTTCSACHLQISDFQSNTPLDIPDRTAPGVAPVLPRHTPSLLNLVYAPAFRWDGSLGTDLIEQMVIPFAEPNMDTADRLPAEELHELDFDAAKAALFERLTATHPGYVALYQEAFGVDIRTLQPQDVWRLTGQALAVYVRLAVSRDSAFDRWNAGDDEAMDEDALAGLEVFLGDGRCIECHQGSLFSDFVFHNISTSPPGPDGTRLDEGRFLVTGNEDDRGRFLTPSLRSAGRTSPYFHDGSAADIEVAIKQHVDPAYRQDPAHDPILADAPGLTDQQLSDLAQFIGALEGQQLPIDQLGFPDELPE